MLTAYEIPASQFSLPATTDIARYRFVAIDSSGLAVQANTTSTVIGVSRNEINSAKSENQVLDIADGIVVVEASEPIACGAKVASTSVGKAAVAQGTAYVGIAFSAAGGDGELIAVKFMNNVGVDGDPGDPGDDGVDGMMTQTILYTSEDLGAEDDITATAIGVVIGDGTLLSANIIALGTAAGIGAEDTSVFEVKVNSTDLATYTFDGDNNFPAENAAQAMDLEATVDVSEGDVPTLTVTNGTNANLPVFMVQLVFGLSDGNDD